MTQGRSRFKTAIFASLPTLALLAGGECVARVRQRMALGPEPDPRVLCSAMGDQDRARAVFRDFLSVRIEPRAYVIYHLVANQHFATVNANALGLRGPEIEPEKAAGTIRVCVLGGSVVWGTGASSDDATVAGRLQSLLAADLAESRVEVVNCGQSGYNSTQERILLENEVLPLDPDAVVLLHGANDAFYARCRCAPHDHPYQQRLRLAWEQPPSRRLLESVLDASVLCMGIRARLHAMGDGRDGAETDDRVDIAPALRAYESNVRSIALRCASEGIPCVEALQPALGAEPNVTDEEASFLDADPVSTDRAHFAAFYGGIREAQARLADIPGCTAIDLSDAYSGRQRSIYIDWVHTGDEGMRLLAERLRDVVLPLVRARRARPLPH